MVTHNNSAFLIESAQQVDRHIEKTLHLKYEKVTMQINLVSSGDSRKFKSEDLIAIIMERLKVIHNDNA